MIQGHVDQKLVPYRQKEGLNFSSIKTFDVDGLGVFYKEYILGQRDEKTSNALIIGSLVDDIVLTYGGDLDLFYQNFEEKYVKLDGVKSSSQVFELADAVFDSLKETMTSDGKITGDFEYCFREAFAKIQEAGKYKGKTWEKGLEDFEKNGRSYFDTRISNIGKTAVDLKVLNIAEKVSKTLLTDSFTASLMKGEDDFLIPKVVVEFDYLGIKCKSELDFVLINHKNKTIQGGDLKCTFDNEDFPYSYIKNRYYLQQAFYSEALKTWKKEQNFNYYTEKPFIFVVADTSSNNRRPLVYELSSKDMQNGFTGFSLNGKKYKGIAELVSEIKWHIDSDIWNCSKEVLENEGKLKLDIHYD